MRPSYSTTHMSDRFFYAGDWQDDVILSGTEAHHLTRVLRKQPGDDVELFDGQGTAAQAVVENVSKWEVSLKLLSQPEMKPKPRPLITLAVAPPKGDRFRWLIEKATEIGVDRIIPIQTARSVVVPGEKKLEKLHQTMISACKQSGRNHFMDIEPSQSLESLGEGKTRLEKIYYGDVPTPQSASSLPNPISDESTSILVIIGPEGGLSDTEIELIVSWEGRPICVSSHVLRVETAAIALASLLIAVRLSKSA